MSMILSLMLASALTQAKPVGPATWLSDSDYPAGAKRRREEGAVSFSFLIAQDGRIAKCFITESSGFPELDDRTCALMAGRVRFKPATDENGMAAYSLYNSRLTWLLPGKRASPSNRLMPVRPSDIELQVQRLPNGAQEETVGIAIKVDPTGHITFCEPANDKESSPKLVAVACAEAKANYASIQTDGDGNPVTMIRSLRVTFKATPP